jgi:hypothetical protein
VCRGYSLGSDSRRVAQGRQFLWLVPGVLEGCGLAGAGAPADATQREAFQWATRASRDLRPAGRALTPPSLEPVTLKEELLTRIVVASGCRSAALTNTVSSTRTQASLACAFGLKPAGNAGFQLRTAERVAATFRAAAASPTRAGPGSLLPWPRPPQRLRTRTRDPPRGDSEACWFSGVFQNSHIVGSFQVSSPHGIER